MYPSEKLLLKVFDDLKDFLPYLVLIGGWVPHIYAKYVWKEIPTTVITTTDMDFGIVIKEYKGDESISSRVRKLGYGEHHISMDRPIPFVPVVKSPEGLEKADVEFISIPKPPKYIKEKLIGKEIKVNEIKNFNVLLESITEIIIDKYVIQIPTESMFVFHKLLTFIQRENEEKLRKDLYYAYYIFRFCPQKGKLVQDIKFLIKDKKVGRNIVRNINKYFKNVDSKGPILIERENGPDNFVSNVRADAYERISQVLI